MGAMTRRLMLVAAVAVLSASGKAPARPEPAPRVYTWTVARADGVEGR